MIEPTPLAYTKFGKTTMQRATSIIAAALMGSVLIGSGCESMLSPVPGIHFRADNVVHSIPEAQQTAKTLVAEIGDKTGLVGAPIFVADDKYHTSVYADLRDENGYAIQISIYPRERSLFLDIQDIHLPHGQNPQREERVKELAEIARKIVDSHFTDRPLKPCIRKQGILAP